MGKSRQLEHLSYPNSTWHSLNHPPESAIRPQLTVLPGDKIMQYVFNLSIQWKEPNTDYNIE